MDQLIQALDSLREATRDLPAGFVERVANFIRAGDGLIEIAVDKPAGSVSVGPTERLLAVVDAARARDWSRMLAFIEWAPAPGVGPTFEQKGGLRDGEPDLSGLAILPPDQWTIGPMDGGVIIGAWIDPLNRLCHRAFEFTTLEPVEPGSPGRLDT